MKLLITALIGLLAIGISQAQERTRPEGPKWSFQEQWNSNLNFINANGLGRCYDIRRVDPLNWAAETLGIGQAANVVELIPDEQGSRFNGKFIVPKGVRFTSDIRGDAQTSTKFVQSAYDFENQVSSSYSIEVSGPIGKLAGSAKASQSFNEVARSSSSNEFLSVFTTMYKQYYKLDLEMNSPTYKHYLNDRFYDWVKRIGEDVTPEGFIYNFGTHYASTTYYGGNFLQTRTVNKSSYANSTKSEQEFKFEVEANIKAINIGGGTTQGSSSSASSSSTQMFVEQNVRTVGGELTQMNPEQWARTVENKLAVVGARLTPLSDLLTPANFPDVPDINQKRQLLQAAITRYENEVKNNRSRPENGSFFKKSPVQLKMTVSNIKCNAGSDSDGTNEYYGTVSMGFFNANQQILTQNAFWQHGETTVDVITKGSSKPLGATLTFNVQPQDFANGFVAIWGNMTERAGAANQVDNSNVGTTIVSVFKSTTGALQEDNKLSNRSYSESATQIPFEQAIASSMPVTRPINFTGSGNNVEFTVTLQRVDQQSNASYRAAVPSSAQLNAAASSGNIQQVKMMVEQGGQFDGSPGALNAMITSKNLNGLNDLMDLGARPQTADLDLALTPPMFNRNVVLSLLERGARPTDAQFETSMQYNDEGLAKAFLREGVTPRLSHMQQAIANDQIKLVYAFVENRVVPGPAELDYAVRKNDAKLAGLMIAAGSTAAPTSLLTAITNNNQPMADLLIPVTPPSHEALEASAMANNAELFKLFVDKGSRLANNNPVNIAVDKQNLQVLDMALKAGGDANAGLEYAISKSNTSALVTCLQNQAVPDPGFAYVVAQNDKPLYDRMLNEFNGNADVALGQAIAANKLDFGQSAIATGQATATAQLAAVATAGSLPWVQLLVEAGQADTNVGVMPAIAAQKSDVLNYLISNGANGSNPEYIAKAAELKNLTMVKILVEKGGASPENGKTAAIASGDVNITRYLLQQGAVADGLAVPASKGDIAMVRLLLEFKANPTEGVRAGVEANQTEVAVLLLDAGAAVDGLMPIAANHGNKSVVEKLLSKGANASDGIKPAIVKNFTEVAIVLLNAGASPNGVIDIAAGFGNKEVVGKLLEKGANANDGIKEAVSKKHIDVSKQLIEAGADVKDASFMLIAVNNKQPDMARLLHASGTDVEYVDGQGNSFLHMAADGDGEYAMTKAFIDFGVLIDRANNKGETALHVAVQSGKDNMEVIQVLVENGADVNAVNKDGKTVQRVAKSSKVRKYLKDNGSVRKVK